MRSCTGHPGGTSTTAACACRAGFWGLELGRHRGAATDESLARIGSIALLGAAYLNAGISKLAFGGIDWLSGLPIQAVVVGQDGLVADSILSSYRTWVAETPAAALSLRDCDGGVRAGRTPDDRWSKDPAVCRPRATRDARQYLRADAYLVLGIDGAPGSLGVLRATCRRLRPWRSLLDSERPAVHHCRHGAGIVRVFCRHSSEPPVYAVARNEAG